MADEKPIYLKTEPPRSWLTVEGPYGQRDATRSDLDKALEGLGMKAVDKDVVTDLPGWIAALRDDERRALNVWLMRSGSAYIISSSNAMDGYRELGDAVAKAESERDTANARAETQAEQIRGLGTALAAAEKYRPVVEAARVLVEYIRGYDADAWAPQETALNDALRALDATAEAKLCKRHGTPLHDFDKCDRCECEELRSALTRAEEERVELRRQLQTEREHSRIALDAGQAVDAENDRLRSELQAEKARAEAAETMAELAAKGYEAEKERAAEEMSRADAVKERSEYWWAEYHKKCAECDTIAERTAMAQREACAIKLDAIDTEAPNTSWDPGVPSKKVRATELVTLASLPASESSGREGEKTHRRAVDWALLPYASVWARTFGSHRLPHLASEIASWDALRCRRCDEERCRHWNDGNEEWCRDNNGVFTPAEPAAEGKSMRSRPLHPGPPRTPPVYDPAPPKSAEPDLEERGNPLYVEPLCKHGDPLPDCGTCAVEDSATYAEEKDTKPEPEAIDEPNCNTGPFGPRAFAAAICELFFPDDEYGGDDYSDRLAQINARIASDAATIAGLRAQRDALWALLDNIDTLDDSCREDDRLFRNRARTQQRNRFNIWNPEAGPK